MSDETWMNARKAVELGFADEILFADKSKPEDPEEEPDEPDKEEEGGDEEEEKKKPFQLREADAVWQFSSRLMGETILNRYGAECQPENDEPEPEAEAPAQEPPEAGMTAPVIGMDGRTEDGSMPYEILKEKLEWMK